MRNGRHMLAALAVLAFVLIPGAVLGKKPSKPPPEPQPVSDPAIAYLDGGDLMVMNSDGTNQTLVLSGKSTGIGRPDWSPDGSKLVFASDIQGVGIYVINVDGTGLSKLTDLNHPLLGIAVWSPAPVPGVGEDRYRIAYTDEDPSEDMKDVYLIDPDGTDKIRLTATSDVYESTPTWSPSGEKLAVKVFTEGMQLDRWALLDLGTGAYSLRQHGGALAGASVTNPAWSRTQESEIAWSANSASGGLNDIWIVDLEGSSSPVCVTSSVDLEERFPCWSPDDALLVFSSSEVRRGRLRDTGIEVSSVDGSNRVRLMSGGLGPRWRRNSE